MSDSSVVIRPGAAPIPYGSLLPERPAAFGSSRAIPALLTIWVAFMGTDRINLAAGAIDFIVTPFIALTPFILLVALLGLGRSRGTVSLPPNTARYCLTATLFLCVISVSAIFSGDPVMAGRRTILLVVQLYGSFLVAILLLNQRRPTAILVRGAYLGLVVATVFVFVQLYYWVTDGWNTSVVETELFFNFAPRTYGLLPRLSGSSVDQSRAGLLYFVYLFIIVRFAPQSKLRTFMIWLAVVSLIGTLSRSAMLGAIVLAGFYSLERGVKITRGRILGVSSAVAAAVVLLLLIPSLVEVLGETLEPLAGRFSGDEASARIHFALIEHGILVATSSFRNALLGVGYGNGWMVLTEYFPGDRFGNFHSLYVTLLAESGVFALALGLLLLVYPFLVPGGPFLSVVAGLMAANVFYQSPTEPAFWLVIALAWLTAGSRLLPSPQAGGLRKAQPQPSLRTTPAIGA